ALSYRGVTYGEQGDVDKAIADFTAVIELDDAPPEQVAIALFYRGVTYGEQGDVDKAIADYSAVIELDDAPPEQVAIALFYRGVTYGEQGDVDKAIADYSAVIELDDAPPEQVAIALFYRGVTFFKQRELDISTGDFKAILNMESQSSDKIRVDAHLAIAEIHFNQGQWEEGFTSLENGLTAGAKADPIHFGEIESLISLAFSAGFGRDELLKKANTFVKLAASSSALAALGEALVQHLGSLHQADDRPGTDQLERWQSAWQSATEGIAEMAIPMRLFRTGIRFLESKDLDKAILLDLKSDDRELLRQALGLAE
ncbi:MAG: tetratricopeptide (TPR) repeat protein, partial [Verrucomicrobiales bacterium]